MLTFTQVGYLLYDCLFVLNYFYFVLYMVCIFVKANQMMSLMNELACNIAGVLRRMARWTATHHHYFINTSSVCH